MNAEGVCISPNDVPGYDKDAYIDPEILANVRAEVTHTAMKMVITIGQDLV